MKEEKTKTKEEISFKMLTKMGEKDRKVIVTK